MCERRSENGGADERATEWGAEATASGVEAAAGQIASGGQQKTPSAGFVRR